MTNTKQTARTMNAMVGCSVNYKGTEGTVVSVAKEVDWMMRVALVDGRIAIIRPSELA